ncbi:hypothetical protein [Salmon gill poxvirus]
MSKRTANGSVCATRNVITHTLDHSTDYLTSRNQFVATYGNDYLMNVPFTEDWYHTIHDVVFMIEEYSYWKDQIHSENQKCPIIKMSFDDIKGGMINVFTDRDTGNMTMYVTVHESRIHDIGYMVRFLPNLKTCKTIMGVRCMDYVIDHFNTLVNFNEVIIKASSVKETGQVENKIMSTQFIQNGYEEYMKNIEEIRCRVEFMYNSESFDTLLETFCFVVDEFCKNKESDDPEHLFIISGFIKSLAYSIESFKNNLYPELTKKQSCVNNQIECKVWKHMKSPCLQRNNSDVITISKTDSSIFTTMLYYNIYLLETTFNLRFKKEICDFRPDINHMTFMEEDINKFVLYTSVDLLIGAFLYVSDRLFTKAMGFRHKNVSIFTTDDTWKITN